LANNWSEPQTVPDISVPDNVVALGVAVRFGYQGGQDVSNVHGADDVVLELESFPAWVDIDPDTLNTRSHGNPITAYIEVPDCLSVEVTVQTPPSPARRWVSLRSTHPTQKQRVVGWVEERNPSIRGESDGGV
jgi:hypothetical protein